MPKGDTTPMPVMTIRGEPMLCPITARTARSESRRSGTRATKMTRLLVWLGGALFVTSLAVCLSVVLFELGEPHPRWLGWAPIATDAVLITVFALHHSVFAREPVKRRMLRVIPEELLRSVYIVDRKPAADRRVSGGNSSAAISPLVQSARDDTCHGGSAGPASW